MFRIPYLAHSMDITINTPCFIAVKKVKRWAASSVFEGKFVVGELETILRLKKCRFLLCKSAKTLTFIKNI